MLLNKKCLYLGVSLFSAMILGSMSSQNVKADTTSDTTPTENSTDATSQSSASTVNPTVSTQPTSSSVNSTAATQPTSSSVSSTAATQPATSSVSSTAATQPTSSSVSSTAVTQPTSSSVSSTTSTQPTSSTSGTTTAGTTSTTSPASTTTTPASTYAIPSDINDDTVVTFTDPNLEAALKSWMNIPYTSNLTVGDIKSYTGNTVEVEMTSYDLAHPNGPTSTGTPGAYLSDEQSTPIESLNGMQYLQLLPAKTSVMFQAMLASDPNANTDLTPLDNLNLSSVTIGGDFSDPSAKEIDANQINQLNLSKATSVSLEGSNATDGINQQDLNEIAPTLNSYANNGQGFNMIEFDNSSISDFSPLKGTETGNSVMIDAVSNVITDPTPVYAIDGQPITFTAPKVLDPSGTDIANKFTYSTTVPKTDLKDDDLTNTSGDSYTLNDGDQTATTLSYGNYGFTNGYASDSAVKENLGNTYFENATTINQPLVWQAYPTVTVDYVGSSGNPITVDGKALSKTIDGSTVGSTYDLTPDSQVAGYTLATPTSMLKGTYTAAPQTIDLIYNLIPASSSSTTTTTPTTPVIPATSEQVQIQDVTGQTQGSAYLSDIDVKGTTTVNGREFYLLDNDELVAASDYDAVTSTAPGIIRTFGTTVGLVNAQGEPINVTVEPNTAWKYDKIVAINGQGYYQVASDEFLPVDGAVSFTPTTAKTNVSLGSATVVYNSEGQALTTTLPAGSTWRTDGCAIINGIKMYRVASDEYVSATDTKTYTPTTTDYRTTATTTLYDQNGTPLRATLPAGTSWKVDRIVTINGQSYYRVATDEYVKA